MVAVLISNSLPGFALKKLTKSINQPAVLQFEYYGSVYTPGGATPMAIGTEVEYTDSDLGYAFKGKVNSLGYNFGVGEGHQLRAVDDYFNLNKNFANLFTSPNSAPINKPTYRVGFTVKKAYSRVAPHLPLFRDTPKDAITRLLTQLGIAFDTVSLNAVTGINTEIDEPNIKKGATYDDWLSELLSLTDSGFAYLDYVDVGHTPTIFFGNYGSAATFAVGVSDFGTPAIIIPNGTPLMLNGNLNLRRSSKRAATYTLEGAGKFKRTTGRDNVENPAGQSVLAANIAVYYHAGWPNDREIRIKTPWPLVTKRMIDPATGVAEDYSLVYFNFTYSIVPPSFTFVLHTDDMELNDDYIALKDNWSVQVGWLSDNFLGIGAGSPTFGYCHIWCTNLVEPLIITQTAAPTELDGQITEMIDKFYYYEDFTGAFVVSSIPEMQAYFDKRFVQVTAANDRDGSLICHISGLNTSIKLGAVISGPAPFTDMIVNQITYDLEKRNTDLIISPQPLNEIVEEAKFELRRRRELNSNNIIFYRPPDPPDISDAFNGVHHVESGA
jgi:hypothetical protein